MTPAQVTGTAKVDPAPLALVNAYAQQIGQYGVSVDTPSNPGTTHFYKATAGKWMQVLALNRSTLELIKNQTFACPDAHVVGQVTRAQAVLATCVPTVQNYLKTLNDNDLVVAVSPHTTDVGNPEGALGFSQALAAIGVAPTPTARTSSAGIFAAIGVPGWSVGSATQVMSPRPSTANSASLSGYLIRNNEDLYEFEYPSRWSFNTQAPGSTTAQNVTTIGDQVLKTATPGPGGVLVTTIDEHSVPPSGRTQYFQTGTGPNPSNTTIYAAQQTLLGLQTSLSSAVNPQAPQITFVMSVGNPALQISTDRLGPTSAAALANVQDLLASLGGTVRGAESIFNGSHSYTLVGQGQTGRAVPQLLLGDGQGTQLLGALRPDGLNGEPAIGELAQGSSALTVESAAGATVPGDAGAINTSESTALDLLGNVVYGQPSPAWPGSDSPTRSRAIAYLGCDVLRTPNPRTQYWTQPPSFWSDTVKSQIQGAPYPPEATPGCTGGQFSKSDFSEDDLKWAKSELLLEIGWVQETYKYFGDIARPSTNVGWATAEQLRAVGADINDKVKVASDKKVVSTMFDVIDGLGDITDAIPVVKELVRVGFGVAKLASTITEYFHGEQEAGAPFSSTVAQLGEQLSERLTAMQTTLSVAFPRLVVSDYAKLHLVGMCAYGGSKCPQEDDPSAWQITQSELDQYAKVLQYAQWQTFYPTLVAAKYKAYTVGFAEPHNDIRYWMGHNFTVYVCPFKDEADSARYAITTQGGDHGWLTEPMGLGFVTDEGTYKNPYTMNLPEAGITNRMWDPIDPALNINKGGLGLSEEAFFQTTATHEKLEYFPWNRDPASDKIDYTRWATDVSLNSCVTRA